MANIIHVDFGGRTSQSKYHEIPADEPHLPVIVSVYPEGIEIIQRNDDEEISEVFVTDEQLAMILLLINQSEKST